MVVILLLVPITPAKIQHELEVVVNASAVLQLQQHIVPLLLSFSMTAFLSLAKVALLHQLLPVLSLMVVMV